MSLIPERTYWQGRSPAAGSLLASAVAGCLPRARSSVAAGLIISAVLACSSENFRSGTAASEPQMEETRGGHSSAAGAAGSGAGTGAADGGDSSGTGGSGSGGIPATEGDAPEEGVDGGVGAGTAGSGVLDAGMAAAGGAPADASLGGAGGRAPDAGGSPEPACEDGKVVHFVYFVERDVPFSERQRADVEAQAYAFQKYWHEQLGVTFYLSEPIVDVIEADHDAAWYLNTPDGIHRDPRWYRLGNVKKEVYAKLRIRDFDANHRVVNYPTTRYDGHVGGNFGGAWMDGDDLTCMAEIGGVNYPYPEGVSAHCMGHVAHEFGHVLGLDHEGPQTDCMQFGFYNNSGGNGMCDFSADNVAKILADPGNVGWFEAQPGQTCRGKKNDMLR